jgi:flagellar M-ring protein FliF
MDVTLKKLVAKLAAFWGKISRITKIMIIGGVAAAILIVVILNATMNTTQYTQLFNGLSDSESGAVVTQLKTLGVKYKIEGSTILVDSSKADETRMTLAESGYPQSTLNYNTYTSGSTWADTDGDKKQKVLYQLQDRLEQTINTIPSISSSVVTIVDNQNDTYVLNTDQVTATASVKLNLRPGRTLSQKQINGIVQLVASGVPSLSKDNVTVLDSDGTQLNGNSSGVSGNTTGQLELKNSVENEIKQKVLAVLKPVFGSGNVSVEAGATLDFDQTSTSKTTYTSPNGSSSGVGVPSTQSTGITVSGGTSGASGVAGVNGGETTYTTSSGSTNGNVTQQNQQTSYLYDTEVKKIESQGGTMTGLTIAVLLNNKTQSVANTDTKALSQIVAYAVGLKDTTNISVQLVPFLTPTASSVATKTASTALSPLMIEGSAVILAVALIAVILLMLLSRGKKRKNQALPSLAKGTLDTVLQAEEGGEMSESPLNIKSIEQTIEEAAEKNTIKKQIADFTDDKPELVAQLLKNWLKD